MRLTFHKKDSLEKIKEATLLLISEQGYNSVTMRKVAKEAGVALGQVTYYYHTKESLVLSVIKESLSILDKELKNSVNKSTDKVKEVSNFFENIIVEDEKMMKLVFSTVTQSINNEKIRKLILEFVKNTSSYIKDIYDNAGLNLTDEEKEMRIKVTLGTFLEKAFENIIGLNTDNIFLNRG